MPNGSDDWVTRELPNLDRFFGLIEPVLADFAEKHNLKITKYYHQSNNWTFGFRHPLGGLGKIFVRKANDGEVAVSCAWQIAEYETGVLYSRHTQEQNAHVTSSEVLRLLAENLSLVLAWAKADLEPSAERFRQWRDVPIERFYQDERTYPIARP